MKNCIFCKIISGDIPANIIYSDDHVIAIDDLHPQAPHHKLIIPRKHIATLNDLTSEDTLLMGQMTQTARQLAQALGLAENGYRVIMNCNADGGQAVYHIHMHLLGGRTMIWPPG